MKPVHCIQLIACLIVLTFFSPVFAKIDSIPDALVLLPEFEHAIIVEKETQTLYVYAADAKKVKQVAAYPCSTGEVAGPKLKAGDKKTPEGVYFLKDEYEERYLTPVYGARAFPSDYPNYLDQRQGKGGSAIWIHGTDKTLKPMDSNGCIALDNENVVTLADYIALDATPMIIVERIQRVGAPVLAQQRQALEMFLASWKRSLESGAYHAYLAHYAPEYLPDMAWWERWLAKRTKAQEGQKQFELVMENLGLYHHDGIDVAIMDLYLAVGNERRHLGKRQFFMGQKKEGTKIVGELFQKMPKAYENREVPLLGAAGELFVESPEKAVIETVEAWLGAWSAKDHEAYAGFYDEKFSSEGMNKKAWVARKKRIAGNYSTIRVTGNDYQVAFDKGRCVVTFLQDYRSNVFTNKGTKELILVNKGGVWKIYRENWKGR